MSPEVERGIIEGTSTPAKDLPVEISNESKERKAKVKKPGFVPGGGLPAIPGQLVEKIRNGDWVDFQDLLPENIMNQFKDWKDK